MTFSHDIGNACLDNCSISVRGQPQPPPCPNGNRRRGRCLHVSQPQNEDLLHFFLVWFILLASRPSASGSWYMNMRLNLDLALQRVLDVVEAVDHHRVGLGVDNSAAGLVADLEAAALSCCCRCCSRSCC